MAGWRRKPQTSPANPPPTGEEGSPDTSEDQLAVPEGQTEEVESAEPPRAEGEESVEQASAPSEGLAAEVEVIEQAPEEVEPVGESTPEGINEADIEAALGMKLPKDSGEAMRKLSAALIKTRKERDEEVDKWKRIAAEYDNSRKRSERESRERVDRDRHKSKEEASERLMLELVPILDALDSALKVEISTTESMRQGMEGVRHLLLEVMKREGLTLVDATPGMPFDSKVHYALAAEGSGDVVKVELRRGYRYRSGKLLRPAEVEVGFASSTKGEDTAESLAENAVQSDAADVGDGAVVPPDDSVSGVAEDGGAPEEGETPVGKD